MNLNTITEVKRPTSTDEIPEWRKGYAWLAGGTWLFSTPQIATHTLIDLETLRWPALKAQRPTVSRSPRPAPSPSSSNSRRRPNWTAAPLLKLCCHALLMSFKIYNAATVGGNICMSLPAGAMISLAWRRSKAATRCGRGTGSRAKLAALDFVTGNHMNVLEPGELLRSIHLPASALEKRFAFRRNSLTHLGRSAALVVGTRSPRPATISCSPSRRRRPGRYSFISTGCRRPARCTAPSTRPSTTRTGSTTCTARRPISAISLITTPSRSGRSSPRHEPHGQRQEAFGRAGARPVPQNVFARSWLVRRQERLRPGRLRRLHRLARRRAVP